MKPSKRKRPLQGRIHRRLEPPPGRRRRLPRLPRSAVFWFPFKECATSRNVVSRKAFSVPSNVQGRPCLARMQRAVWLLRLRRRQVLNAQCVLYSLPASGLLKKVENLPLVLCEAPCGDWRSKFTPRLCATATGFERESLVSPVSTPSPSCLSKSFSKNHAESSCSPERGSSEWRLCSPPWRRQRTLRRAIRLREESLFLCISFHH